MTTCPNPRPLWRGPGLPPVATCCTRHHWQPLAFTYPPEKPRGSAR